MPPEITSTMKHKLLVLILPFAALVILSSSTISDNGKAGKTGSPNELTCIDCHASFSPNSGGGSISFSSPGMPGFQYTPGQTYNMSVTVSKASVFLFGVGIEALTSSNNNGGTLNITDAASTQIKFATVSAVSRRNVVHTLGGGVGSGSKVFNFSWTAPAAGTGNVTIYFAGVAADGSTDEDGDYVYNSSQVLTESTCQTPAQPGAMTGDNTVCSGTSQNYSVTLDAGATSYTWTLPSGWTGTSTTNSITATAGNTSGSIIVTANNACGPSTQRSFSVTSSNITATTGSTNVSCFGGSNGTATVTPAGGTGGYTYAWSPSGGTSATATNLSQGTYTCTITDGSGCTKTSSATVTAPAAIISNAVSTNAPCANDSGSASASPAGGVGPYSYLWSPGGRTTSTITVPAGTYTVTVTDLHSCTSTQSVSITQPAPVTIGISTTYAGCSATTGTATATPSGGTGSYSYSWSTVPVQHTATAINLAGGNYSVTVSDSNGCAAISNAQIFPLAPMTGTTNTVMVNCFNENNGMASVSVSGGSPTYSYLWNTIPVQVNDTATNLMAGTYSITVTDSAGCIYTSNVTITQPNQIIVNSGGDSSICEGNTITLTGSVTGGITAYSYLWTPATGLSSSNDSITDATPVITTPYTLTVTDANGCTSSSTVTISILPVPVSTITLTGDSLFASTADSYSWFLNGNNIPGATGSSYYPMQNGDYFVITINANGCSDTSAILTLTTVGINNVLTEGTLKIYPNPATEYLTIEVDKEFIHNTATLFDVCGKPVLKLPLNGGSNTINISGIAEGFYSIVISNGETKITQRLIIR